MSLECRTSEPSVVREWSIVGISDPQDKKIFSNWNSGTRPTVSPRFGFDVDQYGAGELYSNVTQSEDSGTYICSVDLENEISKYRAEVIVIESEPVCSVNVRASSIAIVCTVRYSGNWAPKMEWRHCSAYEDHEHGALFTNGVEDFVNETLVMSTLNAVLYSAKDSLIVSCKTFFEQRNNFKKTWATNVPHFVRLWRSPVFGSKHRLYKPSITTMKTLDEHSDGSTSSENISHDNGYLTSVSVGAILAILILLLLLGSAIYVIRRRGCVAARFAAANKREQTGEAIGSETYDSIPDFYYEDVVDYEVADKTAVTCLTSGENYEKIVKPTIGEHSLCAVNSEARHRGGDEMPSAESIARGLEEETAPTEAKASPYLEIIYGNEKENEVSEQTVIE